MFFEAKRWRSHVNHKPGDAMSSANEKPPPPTQQRTVSGLARIRIRPVGVGLPSLTAFAVIYLASMLASSRRSENERSRGHLVGVPNRACAIRSTTLLVVRR